MMVTFKSDIGKRKKMFTPESFAHPAKMHLGMLLWVVGKYTKPGDTILDPMFGSGSTMLAARYGRNVIGVELEQKFVDIAKGYDCDGKIKEYKQVWFDGIKEGWYLNTIAGGVFCENYKSALVKFAEEWDTTKTTPQEEIYWQEGVEGHFEGSPIPAHCGKVENHEPHYVPGNWDKVKSLPKTKFGLGSCQIVQGDARSLEGLLVDRIVTSPPFGDMNHPTNYLGKQKGESGFEYSDNPDNIGNIPYGKVDAVISSPPYENTAVPPHTQEGEALRLEIAKQRGVSPDKVSYMDYTKKQPDVILTSPPYEATLNEKQHNLSGIAGRDPAMRELVGGYSGKVDAVISSPPYEGSLQGDVEDKVSSGFNSPQAIKMIQSQARGYSKEANNIGNLRSTTYLEAMLQVYQACYNVLKPNGLMILVTKDFIRKGQRILLSIDTIALCEQAGFVYEDWHQRKLTQQSFWRTLYYKKHPEVEKLDTEDILVFRKPIISTPQWSSLRVGGVDAIVSSPPYAETFSVHAGGNMRLTELGRKTTDLSAEERQEAKELAIYSRNEENISNLPYGSVDTIISSPPYAETRPSSSAEPQQAYQKHLKPKIKEAHQGNPSNIGNLPYNGVKVNDEWIKSRQAEK